MKKQLLSILLMFAMLLGMVPSNALAANVSLAANSYKEVYLDIEEVEYKSYAVTPNETVISVPVKVQYHFDYSGISGLSTHFNRIRFSVKYDTALFTFVGMDRTSTEPAGENHFENQTFTKDNGGTVSVQYTYIGGFQKQDTGWLDLCNLNFTVKKLPESNGVLTSPLELIGSVDLVCTDTVRNETYEKTDGSITVKYACGHFEKSTTYTSVDGTETHIATTTCDNCSEKIDEATAACEDADKNGLCDLCGGTVVCKHTNITTSYERVEGREAHTVTVTCECGVTIGDVTTEDCADEDKNEFCDKCNGAVELTKYELALPETITAAVNGKSVTTAAEGQIVVLTLNVPEGQVLDGLSVAKSGNAQVTCIRNNNGTYSFTMPGEKVVVSVNFGNAISLEITNSEKGEITAWVNDAPVIAVCTGQTVTLKANVTPGKKLSSMNVRYGSENAVDVTENEDGTWTFVVLNNGEQIEVLQISADYVCAHMEKTTIYKPVAGEEKHTVTVICDACEDIVGEVTTEACEDIVKDGLGECYLCGGSVTEPAVGVSVWDGETYSTSLRTTTYKGETVYLINSAADLVFWARENSASTAKDSPYRVQSIVLNTNIDLADHEWPGVKQYGAIFYGMGRTISGLNVAGQGFISALNHCDGNNNAKLHYNGIIRDLTLEGSVNYGGVKYGSHYVGAFVGKCSGEIRNCISRVTVTSEDGNYVGGIIGWGEGTTAIRNCANYGDVTSNGSSTSYGGNVAGIAGRAPGALVTNCYNRGNIKGYHTVAGIANGDSKNSITIRNCYNTGNVQATRSNGGYGPIAGLSIYEVENCYYLNNASYTGGESNMTGTALSAADLKASAGNLGAEWVKDTYDLNDGYPIQKWQAPDISTIMELTPPVLTAATAGTISSAMPENVPLTVKLNGQSLPVTKMAGTYNDKVFTGEELPVYHITIPAGTNLYTSVNVTWNGESDLSFFASEMFRDPAYFEGELLLARVEDGEWWPSDVFCAVRFVEGEVGSEESYVVDNTITVTAPDGSVQDANAGIQYRVSTDNQTWGEWQSGEEFYGLTPGETYYFQARYISTNHSKYLDSQPSNVVSATVASLPENVELPRLSAPVLTAALADVKETTITLTYPKADDVEGYIWDEFGLVFYRIGTVDENGITIWGEWSDGIDIDETCTFSGLNKGARYGIQARFVSGSSSAIPSAISETMYVSTSDGMMNVSFRLIGISKPNKVGSVSTKPGGIDLEKQAGGEDVDGYDGAVYRTLLQTENYTVPNAITATNFAAFTLTQKGLAYELGGHASSKVEVPSIFAADATDENGMYCNGYFYGSNAGWYIFVIRDNEVISEEEPDVATTILQNGDSVVMCFVGDDRYELKTNPAFEIGRPSLAVQRGMTDLVHKFLETPDLSHEAYEQVLTLEEQIDKVTVDKYSDDAIKAAEQAYTALSADQQKAVKNYKKLQEKRAQYENMQIGDLNGDKTVDQKDVTLLIQFLAEVDDAVIAQQYADLNQDNSIDLLDLIILRRHLAGWIGYGALPFVAAK